MRELILVALAAVLTMSFGCATRTVTDTVVDSALIQIRLRSEKQIFGEMIARGFDHPAELSAERLRAILDGIEIDTSKDDHALVRERKAAISSKLMSKLSERLAEAYAQAGPDQELVVIALRKQLQHGVFNRKYMTSFVTYIRDGELYIHLSRVEYKLEEHQRSKLPPDPRPGDDLMSFRTVSNAVYKKVGAQGLKVDWQSDVFGVAQAAGIPKSAPKPEPDAVAPLEAPIERATPAPRLRYEELDSKALRALADLEDARRAGRIDDAEYQARRKQLFTPPTGAP